MLMAVANHREPAGVPTTLAGSLSAGANVAAAATNQPTARHDTTAAGDGRAASTRPPSRGIRETATHAAARHAKTPIALNTWIARLSPSAARDAASTANPHPTARTSGLGRRPATRTTAIA